MALRDHRVFNRGRQTQSDAKKEQVHNDIQGLIEKNIFDTAVVAEFISDPEEFLATTVEIDESSLGSSLRSKIKQSGANKASTMFDELTTGTKKVENPYLVQLMPKNSIIAYNITNAKNHSSPDPEVFFPFFPAHFSMPVKTGEHVWCFYENIGKKRVGYWVFRKSSTMQVDDLNYTFLERQVPISTLISTKQDPNTSLNKGKFKTLVRNLGYKFEDFRAGGDGSGALKVDIDKLVADSISYKEEFIGEPVPRHSKKCSDLVLQGSNNTIITMTHLNRTESGTIILAAGKSMGTISSGELTVKNTRGDSAKSFEHNELDKTTMLHSDIKIENEGSTDDSKASLTITEDTGGSILAQAANSSFLKMDTNEAALSRNALFDYSNSQITLIDDQIGIEAPSIVSIRAPNGEIKLAYTGDAENPTLAADILMNDGDQPYVRYEELSEILKDIVDDIATINAFVEIFINPPVELTGLSGPVGPVLEAISNAVQGVISINAPAVPTANFPKIEGSLAGSYTSAILKIGNINTPGTIASNKIFGS